MKAPWTVEQCEALNRWQHAKWIHPFTCGYRDSETHKTLVNGDYGVLIATPDGWICPDCDYIQDWAHDCMVEDPEIMNPWNWVGDPSVDR